MPSNKLTWPVDAAVNGGNGSEKSITCSDKTKCYRPTDDNVSQVSTHKEVDIELYGHNPTVETFHYIYWEMWVQQHKLHGLISYIDISKKYRKHTRLESIPDMRSGND